MVQTQNKYWNSTTTTTRKNRQTLLKILYFTNFLIFVEGKLSSIREIAKISSLNYKELSLVVDEAGAFR